MSESKTERDWLKLARARLASIAHLPPAPPAPPLRHGGEQLLFDKYASLCSNCIGDS